MPPIRALIADDEPLALERLRRLLARHPDVAVVGECADGDALALALARLRPDVAFLDVQMPGRGALEYLATLPARLRPCVVFVTAHERFAVAAFEAEATDYLLKPFGPERLAETLGRVERYLTRRDAAAWPAAPPQADTLQLRADGRILFVSRDEVIRAEAEGNYVALHLACGRRILLREPLRAMEQRLGTDRFIRANRSALVRRDCVRELLPSKYGDYVILLRDGARIPLSRALRAQFEKAVSG